MQAYERLFSELQIAVRLARQLHGQQLSEHPLDLLEGAATSNVSHIFSDINRRLLEELLLKSASLMSTLCKLLEPTILEKGECFIKNHTIASLRH